MVQHVSVGSPRPFAGYSNSEFAYIGVGASQDLPFPGKRALRGQLAERQSEVALKSIEPVRQDAIEKLKIAYFRLAYLQQTLALLEETKKSLQVIETVAESRYRVGQSTQQDVLKAQLGRTKILGEIAMHHREVGELQADIKALLNRDQHSPDLITEPLQLTQLPSNRLASNSVDLEVRRAEFASARVASELAAKESKPDFNVQYMWQHTADQFRDYYMATFGIRLPNRSRTSAAIAEASARQRVAEKELEAERRHLEGETEKQVVLIRTSEEQLKIYKEGLVPQSEGTLRASLAGYQSGKHDFETLFSAFNDVLRLKIDYLAETAQHEIAIAHVERLMGVALQ
jgi:outer membrane protein TolC